MEGRGSPNYAGILTALILYMTQSISILKTLVDMMCMSVLYICLYSNRSVWTHSCYKYI